MASVRIVTDGAADLPPGIAAAYDINVVAGHVRFGEHLFEGDATQFWEAVRAEPVAATTAAPTVTELATAMRGDSPVIAVHVSGELSATVDHARQAARGTSVAVVDSRSVSAGLGLVALGAGQAVELGLSTEDVRSVVRSLVARVHVHAVIDDAEYLRRSGRAGLIDSHAARRAPRHVLAVQGHAIPLKQFKDRHHALNHLVDHLADHARRGIDRWALTHAAASDKDAMIAELTKRFAMPAAFTGLVGPSVGAHVGPGSVVVGFIASEPQ